MIVPAIIVKDKAFHQEWATVMKVIRLVVNIFIIIVSIATLFAPGSLSGLMKVITWTDLALATADTAIQILKDEIGNTTWGKDFLEAWDMIYLVVGFATALPALGLIFRNGFKILSKLVSVQFREHLAIMLVFAIRASDNFPKFLEGLLVIVLDYATALGSGGFAKMNSLAEHGVYLLKGVEEGSKGVSKFYLCFGDVVLFSGSKADIVKAVNDIITKGKNALAKYLDSLFYAKTGTGGAFKYIDETSSLKIFGQEEPMSCAAACIRQIAKDHGVTISEKAVRDKAATLGFADGTQTHNIGPALSEILPNKTIHHGSVGFDDGLTDMTIGAKRVTNATPHPWIATLRPPGGARHTIIVDQIVGDIVHIRDPWDIGIGFGGKHGVQSTMKLDDFEYFWRGAWFHHVRID
jgi:hypothetical protein